MTQTRSFAAFAPTIELRAAEGQPATIVGYAAVFNQQTTLYENEHNSYREVIAPGAFKRSLDSGEDVICVNNHADEEIIARRSAGTLTLEEDAHGLKVTVKPANTTRSKDLMEDIRSGNIKGMSFRFNVNGVAGEEISIKAEGNKRVELRTIKDVNLIEVSFVTFPAYEGTSVELRTKPPEWASDEENNARRLLGARALAACLTRA